MFLSDWHEFPLAPCLAEGVGGHNNSRLDVVEITHIPDMTRLLWFITTKTHSHLHLKWWLVNVYHTSNNAPPIQGSHQWLSHRPASFSGHLLPEVIIPTHFFPCMAVILGLCDRTDGSETLWTTCPVMLRHVPKNLNLHNDWTLHKLQDLRSYVNSRRSLIQWVWGGQACARNTGTYICGRFTETVFGVGAGLFWFRRRFNGRGYILDPVKLTVSNRITDNHVPQTRNLCFSCI